MDLARLAGEALGKVCDRRVVPRGHQRCHVEGVTHQAAPDLHAFGAYLPSRAAIEGSDANQRCNLTASQGSEFGEQGDQVVAITGPTAGSCADVAELGQIVVLGNQLDQAAIEPGKRLLHRGFAGHHQAAQPAVAQVLELVDAVEDGILRVAPHQQMFGQTLAPEIAPELVLLRPGAGELGDGARIERSVLARRPFSWAKRRTLSRLSR